MILKETHDALLFLESDMQDSVRHRIAGGSAAVFTVRCPGKETPNEDAVALIPYGANAAVIAVADGLGGIRGGNVAAGTAIHTLLSSLNGAAAGDAELRSAILDGIEKANQAVLDLGTGAATTLAVAEIQDGAVRPYHVGDSIVLVTGQRGKIKLQTVPHSPVGFAVEAGMLDESEAMHHEQRHIVSNVIGSNDMRIEVGSSVELAPRDTLLIASDGLLDNLHVDEIVSRLRKGPIEKAARRLAADSHERMARPAEGAPFKPDDLTFVVFRRTPPRRRRPAAAVHGVRHPPGV
jgi:serine/threonine protein phosphatase PrpC